MILVLVFLSLLSNSLCQAGLLGSGTGSGSCSAAPYRASSVYWTGGCPSYAECCTEFGYCHSRDDWISKTSFRDCNGESNGLPLPEEVLSLEVTEKEAGRLAADDALLGISSPSSGGSRTSSSESSGGKRTFSSLSSGGSSISGSVSSGGLSGGTSSVLPGGPGMSKTASSGGSRISGSVTFEGSESFSSGSAGGSRISGSVSSGGSRTSSSVSSNGISGGSQSFSNGRNQETRTKVQRKNLLGSFPFSPIASRRNQGTRTSSSGSFSQGKSQETITSSFFFNGKSSSSSLSSSSSTGPFLKRKNIEAGTNSVGSFSVSSKTGGRTRFSSSGVSPVNRFRCLTPAGEKGRKLCF